jgi:predicted nuclease of predicted toxin-antitoxin system
LLFDQNLSPRLVQRLADSFPGALHVSDIGLDRATDEAVSAYAQANECIVVSKDTDFGFRGAGSGAPRVIWLRLGNCTTRQIEQALRANRAEIDALAADPAITLLMLY